LAKDIKILPVLSGPAKSELFLMKLHIRRIITPPRRKQGNLF
jgi:hypothetical protein